MFRNPWWFTDARLKPPVYKQRGYHIKEYRVKTRLLSVRRYFLFVAEDNKYVEMCNRLIPF